MNSCIVAIPCYTQITQITEGVLCGQRCLNPDTRQSPRSHKLKTCVPESTLPLLKPGTSRPLHDLPVLKVRQRCARGDGVYHGKPSSSSRMPTSYHSKYSLVKSPSQALKASKDLIVMYNTLTFNCCPNFPSLKGLLRFNNNCVVIYLDKVTKSFSHQLLNFSPKWTAFFDERFFVFDY